MKKIKPDGSKTIYVGGIYEVDKTSGGSVTRTVTYYPVAGAMRINSTLYYTLKDHLGSASVVTDASGNVLGEQRYYPFGETRVTTGTIYTDRLFTGQREMAGLGIYHFNARFYSPKLGRFLSADSIIPGAANPQAHNRYSYVANNPLRYTDPTGHYCIDEDANGHIIRVDCDSGEPPSPPPVNPPDDGGNDDGGIPDIRCHNDPDCVLGDNSGILIPTPAPSLTPIVTLPTFTQQPSTQFFTTPGYSVPEFVGGAILFAGGFGFTVFGAAVVFIALGEVFGAQVIPTPVDDVLLLPHAAYMTVVGGFFFFGGIGAMYVGISAMQDAITP